MSLLGALQAAPGMLNSLGVPVIVYHRHSLQTTVLAQADVVSLLLTANAGIGATSLAVAHADGDSMAGRLPAGLRLTIGAAELALAADVQANGHTALSLPVAPLAVALSSGAVIMLARAVQLSYILRRRSSNRQFMPGAGIVTGKVRGVLTWNSKTLPPVEPPIGALLQGEDIFEVDAIAGGSAAWRVKAGKVGE